MYSYWFILFIREVYSESTEKTADFADYTDCSGSLGTRGVDTFVGAHPCGRPQLGGHKARPYMTDSPWNPKDPEIRISQIGSIFKQRTAVERIFSQAVALGIERPKLRNQQAIANRNTLTYVLINLRAMVRVLEITQEWDQFLIFVSFNP